MVQYQQHVRRENIPVVPDECRSLCGIVYQLKWDLWEGIKEKDCGKFRCWDWLSWYIWERSNGVMKKKLSRFVKKYYDPFSWYVYCIMYIVFYILYVIYGIHINNLLYSILLLLLTKFDWQETNTSLSTYGMTITTTKMTTNNNYCTFFSSLYQL